MGLHKHTFQKIQTYMEELQFSGFLSARRCVFGPFDLILISNPLGAGHAFPKQWHMCKGGVIYFCQGFFPCMMASMDGWRDKQMDEWIDEPHDEKNFMKNNHNVFYYM